MRNYLGEQINNYRQVLALTQDQFGAKYSVSGPAIFKFEKGYVKPSLDLWLRISQDLGIPTRKSVLMHVKSKLPEEFQDFIDLNADHAKGANGKKKGKTAKDYTEYPDRKAMRAAVRKDANLQKGLRDLMSDDELWAAYKPTGREINSLRDNFGSLGRGSKAMYREALRLLREFSGAE